MVWEGLTWDFFRASGCGGTTKALLAGWPRAAGERADRNEQRTALHQRTGRQAGRERGELQMGGFLVDSNQFFGQEMPQRCIYVGKI